VGGHIDSEKCGTSAQITTTQKYLHKLPDADQKNLTALDRIRSSGHRPRPAPAD